MVSPSLFYSIVSRIAALALLIAGGLKSQEFFTPTTSDPQWTTVGVIAIELLLGSWLLAGLQQRWSRVVALACFFVFLNIAVLGVLAGKTSCGCFGKVSVRPWAAVSIDALLVIGLLFSPAPQMPELAGETKRNHWLAFSACAFLVLSVLAWLLVAKLGLGQKHIPTKPDDDLPRGVDSAALEQVIQGVERNRTGLHTLVYTIESVITQHPVKRTGTRPVKKGNEIVQVTGTWQVPEVENNRDTL